MLSRLRLGARVAALARPARPMRSVAMRLYSDQPKEAKESNNSESKPSKQESLLTDDILAQAGMDVDESGKPKHGDAEDGASEDQKKRWAGTARKTTDQSSTDIKREQRSRYGYFAMFGAGLGAAAYFARDWDDEEERKKHSEIPNGYDVKACWDRLNARVGDLFTTFHEPVFPKLLPDPLPEPYGRPMTLIVGLEDVLIHSEWTREHGWRTAKRPGLDYFLGYLSQYYEIVIFSNNYMVNAEKAVAKLDPYRATVSTALFREGSRYEKGKIIKDLSHLNRDLSKVVMIDCSADAWSKQPENAIALEPWKGSSGDKELVKLIPFLEYVAATGVEDIRPVLKSFEGTNLGDEYAKREQVARAKFQEKVKEDFQKASWVTSLLGVKPAEPTNAKMPQDVIREHGQRGYEELQKYISEHGEKMLQEEKEREQEIMNEQKFTLNKLVTEGMPKPEEILAIQEQKERERREKEQGN